MAEQYSIFGGFEQPIKKKPDKAKRNWENGFQKWSDEQAQHEGEPFGKCGCGPMCDYCEDNTYGRPCVRALNAMCREKNIKLNYEKLTYVEVWEGNYGKVY